MKSQRFRFKVIAILLISCLLFAGTYGLKNIPEASSKASLRNAIQQLTAVFNSDTPLPAFSAEPAADHAPSLPGEPFQHPPESSVPPTGSVSSPSPPVSSMSPTADPVPENTLKPANFNDALINFFAPAASPSSHSDPTPTPDNRGL